MKERLYTVSETFDVLKRYKITSNVESVRRWLRDGTIKGIAPASRKEGWKVAESALDAFLAERLPERLIHLPSNTTNDVKEGVPHTLNEEQIRAKMWYEITSKNIWEGFVEVKKSILKDVAEHRGYSQQLVQEVWERCVANSSAYKQPRVSYMLDAFSFEGERLLMDQAFTSKEEQIIFAIFEHIKSNSKRLK